VPLFLLSLLLTLCSVYQIKDIFIKSVEQMSERMKEKQTDEMG
jgi:hypothetical protein